MNERKGIITMKGNPIVLLGNEVKGLPLSILRAVDGILEIPMVGRKESLNVAVAFGVVAFGLRFGNGASIA